MYCVHLRSNVLNMQNFLGVEIWERRALCAKVKINYTFSELHILFEKIFCIPATSAPTQHVFDQR